MKAVKFFIGLMMLPITAAVTRLFLYQFQQHTGWNELSLTTWWFIGGFAIWLLLFFLLPRPVRTYVLAHELTHALWGMLMGAKVSKLKVSSRGGSVTLTKTNWIITLAPYFFPFYSFIALAIYSLVSLKWNSSQYQPFWYAVFGLTWSFHLTFTIAMLGIHQPDIHEHGRLFSYVLIYCINLITAAYLLNILTDRSIREVFPMLVDEIKSVYVICWTWVQPWVGRLTAKW